MLYAALEVHDGGIDGWVADSTRSDNFVAFLSDLVQRTAEGLELHCIVDNLSAHSTPQVVTFLDEHPHVFLHNTPTHASWLNQVELFLSIMSRRLLRHGEFDSVNDMSAKVIAFRRLQPHRQAVPLDLRWPTPPSSMKAMDVIYAREHWANRCSFSIEPGNRGR